MIAAEEDIALFTLAIKPPDTFFFFNQYAGRIDFPFGALVPLNFLRVQNLIADNPNGTPCEVIARLECIKIPQLKILLFCIPTS
jgi:hypothetical protein